VIDFIGVSFLVVEGGGLDDGGVHFLNWGLVWFWFGGEGENEMAAMETEGGWVTMAAVS
jgi:hypothetical protein